MLGNIGATELFIILLVVLLLFGAKRLPEVARSLGKSISEFKKGMNTALSDIRDGLEVSENKSYKSIPNQQEKEIPKQIDDKKAA